MTPQTTTANDLAAKLGTIFKDFKLLEQALVHRSYLNENKSLYSQPNERLEFLGDAVLELWTSKKLYDMFPEYPEGDLTNLRSLTVRTENLADVSRMFELGKYVLLSHGEETHGGRENPSILADTFESVLGAIFLDQGMESAEKFLEKYLLPSLKNISKQKIYKDPKSLFQEIAQAKQGITPRYATVKESGPDHQKQFEIGVYLNDDLIAIGKGNSKQKAEEDAAILATQILQKS